MVYHLSVYCLQFLYVQTQTSSQRKGEAGQDPKYSKKNSDFKLGNVRNHSKSFKHPPVTSTNFLPCYKTSSNPFPITSTPPIHPPTADGFRRIRTEAAGENGWLRSRRAQNTQVISCKHMQAVHLFISIPSLQAYQKGDPCHMFFVNMLLKTAVKRRS